LKMKTLMRKSHSESGKKTRIFLFQRTHVMARIYEDVMSRYRNMNDAEDLVKTISQNATRRNTQEIFNVLATWESH
ncbi:unnamed protein product, partial [Onchocerca ochengi]